MVQIGRKNPKIGPAFFDYVSASENKRLGKRSPNSSGGMSLLPLVLLFLSIGVIVARLFYLQVVSFSYYKNLSENNRTKTKTIFAPRGIIYDRYGKPLVSNSQVFQIEENGKKKDITQVEALTLMEKGKKVESKIRREYLYKDDFAHVLGYLGPMTEQDVLLPEFDTYSISESIGKMGMEKTYEKLLHGENGKELLEIDAQGKTLRPLGQKDPIPGGNLNTTLDLKLQLSVKEAMKDVSKGAVVASDPKTGGILAIYSKPSFDPNLFVYSSKLDSSTKYQSAQEILQDSDNQPLLDRAISGVYPPGSTFKLITAVAALTYGDIKEDTIVEDTGILRVGDFSFGNWYFLQYGRTEGPLNIVGAIKRSNDIFFYKAAQETGVENISNFAKNFGLGGKLGIDLEGESKGVVPDPSWKEKQIGEQWYLGDTYNYGIGQGYLLTTPLQVNMFTTVFANDGTLYRPHLVESQKQIIKKDFIKKEYVDLVRLGMEESCNTGGVAWPLFDFKVKNDRLPIDNKDYVEDSSGSARFVKVALGCKTGTAETGDKNTKPHAWITVFAPFYNPEIALTVLVENGGEGSSVAGPIAKQILTDYFEKKN